VIQYKLCSRKRKTVTLDGPHDAILEKVLAATEPLLGCQYLLLKGDGLGGQLD
jgi:hypothetical protein